MYFEKIYQKGRVIKIMHDNGLLQIQIFKIFCHMYIPRNLEIKIYITHTHLQRAGIVKVQCHGT